jgi:hypothetical protein
MAIMQNRLNQRLIITARGGRTIDLLAHGSAAISEEETGSSHIETLVERGAITLTREPKTQSRKYQEPGAAKPAKNTAPIKEGKQSAVKKTSVRKNKKP